MNKASRLGINTDERRAKKIADDWCFLNSKCYNTEKFNNFWSKFLTEKVRCGKPRVIAMEFINRYGEL